MDGMKSELGDTTTNISAEENSIKWPSVGIAQNEMITNCAEADPSQGNIGNKSTSIIKERKKNDFENNASFSSVNPSNIMEYVNTAGHSEVQSKIEIHGNIKIASADEIENKTNLETQLKASIDNLNSSNVGVSFSASETSLQSARDYIMSNDVELESKTVRMEKNASKTASENNSLDADKATSTLDTNGFNSSPEKENGEDESEEQGDPYVKNEDDEREDEMEYPSEEYHVYMLGKICRICAELTVVFDGPKRGVSKAEMVRYVKKIWQVDIADEDPLRYPVNVCQQCERKIKRVYLRVSKRKKCEMFRTKPADFEAHEDHNCSICFLKEKHTITSKQNVQNTEEVTDKSDNSNSKELSEPRRNPARKRSWPDQEPSHKSVECQTEYELPDITAGLEEHDYTKEETLKEYLVLPKKLGGKYTKQPLSSVDMKYVRQERLKPLIAHIDKFCESQKEKKVEVLFFLLKQALRDAGDRARESQITDTWMKRGSEGTSLTDEECLAKRVLLKQTKDQYRKEYSYYREKLRKPVLKPPFIIDRHEKSYFPEHLEYYVTDGKAGPVIYQHEKLNQPSYFALPEWYGGSNKDKGVMGARWRYCDAVAKTLEDLGHTLENYLWELNEDACILVDLSDYCEEKKDFSQLSDKNDSSSNFKGHQRKMITYLFCVQSLQAVSKDTVTWTYNLEGSCFRPLMKALVTEGNALRSSMMQIEEERTAITGKYFHLSLPNGMPLRFVVTFSNAAPEVRREHRNIAGLTPFKKAPTLTSRYSNLVIELKRSWLASSPRLVHVGRVTNLRIKCGRCGEKGHNVRKCSKPSLENAEGDAVVHHKKPKKHRSIRANTQSAPSSGIAQVTLPSQQHHLQQLSLQPQHQEGENPLSCMTAEPSDVSHTNSTIRSDDSLIWNCSEVDGSSHVSQGSQILIPSTNTDYHTMSQRSVIQNSQHGTSPPVYVWTYAVVQPQAGTVVHQQPVGHQIHHISTLPQQSVQHGSSLQEQQHMTVIHQQTAPQDSTSQTSQQLPMVHQQVPQNTLTLTHSHNVIRSSQDQASQHLNVIHQPVTLSQSVDTTRQINLGHQHASSQPQSHQELNLVHSQQVSQTDSIEQHVSQTQQQQHNLEASSPQEQLPQTQGFYFNVFPGQVSK